MNDLIYRWNENSPVQMVANLSLPGGFKLDNFGSVNCDVITATGRRAGFFNPEPTSSAIFYALYFLKILPCLKNLTWLWWLEFRLKLISGYEQATLKIFAHIKIFIFI